MREYIHMLEEEQANFWVLGEPSGLRTWVEIDVINVDLEIVISLTIIPAVCTPELVPLWYSYMHMEGERTHGKMEITMLFEAKTSLL